MIHTTAFKLLNAGKTEPLPASVLVLAGYFEFVGEWLISWATQRFIGEPSQFNYRRFYLDNDETFGWGDIIDEAASATFFVQDRKVVVATLREKNRAIPDKADLETLSAYARKANPNTLLIIYFSLEFSQDDYKLYKKQKIEPLATALEPLPLAWVDLDKADTREIESWIHKQAELVGVKLGGAAMARMFELWADEPLRLLPHVPKVLAAVPPGQEIAVEDVEKLVTGMTTHSIWDLIDAVEGLNVREYMSILKYLVISGVKPPMIIGTLVTHYNKVLLAKLLLKKHVGSNEIGRILKQPSFILNRFLRMVSQVSDHHLRKILELLYQLDYESKQGGEASCRLSLETFILEMKALSLANTVKTGSHATAR